MYDIYFFALFCFTIPCIRNKIYLSIFLCDTFHWLPPYTSNWTAEQKNWTALSASWYSLLVGFMLHMYTYMYKIRFLKSLRPFAFLVVGYEQSEHDPVSAEVITMMISITSSCLSLTQHLYLHVWKLCKEQSYHRFVISQHNWTFSSLLSINRFDLFTCCKLIKVKRHNIEGGCRW